jgi:hypothetical protein
MDAMDPRSAAAQRIAAAISPGIAPARTAADAE